MQNAVFRPNRKICALKKLEGTADLTVSSNFFFGLIFQNSILQQALFCLGSDRKDVHQPANTLVGKAGGLFQNILGFLYVVDSLADFDEAGVLITRDVGAINVGVAGLAVVGLSVPAIE